MDFDFVSRTLMRVSTTSMVHLVRIARESVSRFNGGNVDVGRELDRFQLPEGNDINNCVKGLENCIRLERRVIVYY